MNPLFKLNILLADDHEIFLEGMTKMLAPCDNITIVGKVENGEELVKYAHEYLPDLILTDIVMPKMNGITATKILKEKLLDIKIIALSHSDNDDLMLQTLDAGVDGYLLKSVKIYEIVEAISEVFEDKKYYSKEIYVRLKTLIKRSKFNPYPKKENLHFNQHELDIIQSVCEEKHAKEIAAKLNLSARTVEGYMVKIKEKLQVQSTAGIAIYAIHHGLFKSEKQPA